MSKQHRKHHHSLPAARHIQHPALQQAVGSARWPEAEAEARKILRLQPKDLFALKALGCSLAQQGREIQAIPILQQALLLNPVDAEILNNLGISHLYAGEREASVDYFKKALALKPKDYVVWKNLGRAYVRLGRPRDAVEALARAIDLHPDNYDEALSQLVVALDMGGQTEQSLSALEELWQNGWKTKSVLADLLHGSLKLGAWDSFDERLAEFRGMQLFEREHSSAPLSSLSFPGITWKDHFEIACGYAKGSFAVQHICHDNTAALCRNHSGRLRVGYFSGDFRAHPVGYLIPQVVELHDRDAFEVIGYSVGLDDKSDIRKRIAGAFDHFVDLGQLASRQAVEIIRADNLDVLVNLQGWTNDYASELFAERVAPIQVSWLGYAGTMGHAALADYLIGDPIATPLAQAEYFTETLALLDRCYLPMDTTPGIPDSISRFDAGLPEDKFVFCSFNNCYKINPPLFDLWCEILKLCPDSLLWLSTASDTANQNLIRQFEKRGLEADRLVFAPRVPSIDEHRRRIGAADLALDTFPYNSHSSGLDMLWAGIPMVTCLGDTFASRVGASLLQHCNLAELVAGSTEAYRDLVVALYHDQNRLRQLRHRLQSGRASEALWDTKHLAESLEKIYRTAWENGLEGKKAPIVVR